jgi:glycyl-tRNA synthetase
LLDEITDLVEYPTALRGAFEPAFLRLPKDVLVTVMRKHQRYYPVLQASSGQGMPVAQLMPYFIAVRNGLAERIDVVRLGNEGVLRARFADADFFYRADTAHRLEAFTPVLAGLTVQEKLGSMLDKVHRVRRLVPIVAQMLNLSSADLAAASRAAELCKSDLVTKMVIELTSLQGIMGREYARLSGESETVANAIFAQYLPRYQGDGLPGTRAALALGLAMRLDSLAGLFAVGFAPTGSTDPFGLRREALGLVQALMGLEQSFDLRAALRHAIALLPGPALAAAGVVVEQGITMDAPLSRDVMAFVRDRLYGLLRDEGLPHDVVTAVLAERAYDPYRAAHAARGLTRFTSQLDWPEVLTAYARCKRIVRNLPEIYPLHPEYYTETATQGLYGALDAAHRHLAAHRENDDTEALGLVLWQLQAPINRFFTDILVMAEDPAVRQARLGLVQRIAALPDGIADLGQLQGF